MNDLKQDAIRQAVRQQYGAIADSGQGGCRPSCCGSTMDAAEAEVIAQALGYSVLEVAAVPDGANMGLGCGNPHAIAQLKAGETLLDLGSGAGFDCFLAARQLGASGQVIGVDMTPSMLSKARLNAQQGGYQNVEFRLGEIENLPVADASVDVIISNCVINLSPNKPRVFAESYRVLKPGGRLAISDIAALGELPPTIRDDLSLLSGCIAGAAPIAELGEMLHASGFRQIRILPKSDSKSFIRDWSPEAEVTDLVVSVSLEAIK